MSYDRAINQLCPHLVVDEYLLFGSTRDRVYPMRPISSAGSVKVRLNGLMDVPSYGVATPATSGGSKEGPYNIKYGVNDLLKLRVGAGAWQVCRLPAGAKTSVSQTASILSRITELISLYDDLLILISSKKGVNDLSTEK